MRNLNILLFVASIAALFLCRDGSYLSLVILELVAAVIAVTNRDKPEIFIPLLILMFSKIVDVALCDVFLFTETIKWYLTGAIVLDGLTYYAMLKFYNNHTLLAAAGCSLPPRRIKQVEFIGYVLLANIAYNALVMAELLGRAAGIDYLAGTLFFYSHQTTAMISLKFLMLLAIWSMTLDAWAVRKLNRHQMV